MRDRENASAWMRDRCPECGHRLAFIATACPQCNAVFDDEPKLSYPDLCECARCTKARGG